MGFVESVLCKIRHVVIDLVGGFLRDPVGDAARDALLLVPVHEVFAFLGHDRRFFLGHGPAHQIAPAQGIARQGTDDLHDLLLVNDTAVGRFQNRFQKGGIVPDGVRTVLSPDILRDEVHGTRPVQRDPGDHILQALGLQLLHEAFHPGAFKLEHPVRTAGTQRIQHLPVIVIDLLHVQPDAGILLHHSDSVLNDRQRPEAQEIHLQKSQLLQGGHGELGRDGTIGGSGKGNVLVHILLADHHAGGVHGGMPGKALQTAAHVDQPGDLRLFLVSFFQLRVHGQGFVDGDVQLLGDHLGDGVHLGVGHVQHPAHIPDHTPGREGTEGDNLHHPVLAVFADHIIDHFLPPFEAEIHVDIRHGHTLGVQEPFEQQIIAQGIQLRDIQRISYQAAGRRAASGAYHNIVIPGIFDKVPHDQEIIHIPHVPDGGKLIIQSLLQLRSDRMISLLQAFHTELVQVFPGGKALGHIEPRQLGHAELDLHVAAFRDPVRIFESLQGIGKQLRHLLRRLDIVLSALIAHAVLVRQLFAGLQTQKDIVGLPVLRIGIMAVVGHHQIDPGLPVHPQQLLIDDLLLGDAVILHFQEKIALPENLLIPESGFLSFLVHPPGQIPGHLSRQTCGKGDDPFVVPFQHLQIHPGLVVKALHISLGDDLHQVGVAGVVFGQQNQMIVPVISASALPVEAGARGHIHLTAQHRPDPGRIARTVKFDHAVHGAVVGDRRAVHAQLLHPGHIFFDFVGPIQKAVFRMGMKMCEIHSVCLLL